MPRIFRARPAPPVGRSINIGVTMRPVAARAAPVAAAVNAEPAYVGFADPPVATYFASTEIAHFYFVDFYGVTPADGTTGWTVDVIDGDGVAISEVFGMSNGCIFSIVLAEFTDPVNVRLLAIVNDIDEYEAIIEVAPPE